MSTNFKTLLDVFVGVPLEGGNPKYVPLNKLPVGTVLTFSSKEPVPPVELHEINGKPEEGVVYLPEGLYKIKILEWGAVELGSEGFENRKMKPLYPRLSITSPFIANYDDLYTTFRLQTGNIKWINVGGVVRLNIDQIKQQNTRRPIVRNSRRRGPRGSYQPLRNRGRC